MTYSTKVVYNESTLKFDLTIKFNGKEYKKSFDSLVDVGDYCTNFYLDNVAATETDTSEDCPKLK